MRYDQFYQRLQSMPEMQRLLSPTDSNRDQLIIHAAADFRFAETLLACAKRIPDATDRVLDLIFSIPFNEVSSSEYIRTLSSSQVNQAFETADRNLEIELALAIASVSRFSIIITDQNKRRFVDEINYKFRTLISDRNFDQALDMLDDTRFKNYITENSMSIMRPIFGNLLPGLIEQEAHERDEEGKMVARERALRILSNPRISQGISPAEATSAFRLVCNLPLTPDQIVRLIELHHPHPAAIGDVLADRISRREIDAAISIIESLTTPLPATVTQRLGLSFNEEFESRLRERPTRVNELLEMLGHPIIGPTISDENIRQAKPLITDEFKHLLSRCYSPTILVQLLETPHVPSCVSRKVINEIFVSSISRGAIREGIMMLGSGEILDRILPESVSEALPKIKSGIRHLASDEHFSHELETMLNMHEFRAPISMEIAKEILKCPIIGPGITDEIISQVAPSINAYFGRLIEKNRSHMIIQALANPRILSVLSDENIRQAAPLLNKGLIWMSRQPGGIYALMQILDNPRISHLIPYETIMEAIPAINKAFRKMAQQESNFDKIMQILFNSRISLSLSDETISHAAPLISRESMRIAEQEGSFDKLKKILFNPRISLSLSDETISHATPLINEECKRLANQDLNHYDLLSMLREPRIASVISDGTIWQVAPAINERIIEAVNRGFGIGYLMEMLNNPRIASIISDDTIRRVAPAINNDIKETINRTHDTSHLTYMLRNPRLASVISDDTIRQAVPAINEEVRKLSLTAGLISDHGIKSVSIWEVMHICSIADMLCHPRIRPVIPNEIFSQATHQIDSIFKCLPSSDMRSKQCVQLLSDSRVMSLVSTDTFTAILPSVRKALPHISREISELLHSREQVARCVQRIQSSELLRRSPQQAEIWR